MLAVVLVGGFGTRLRPLTYDVPKPMLPVVHRPMIARLVDRLVGAGVTDVVLALGFRPEPFRVAFPGDRIGDVRVHYAVEPEPLDTGGAIAFAARHAGADGTFLVANGDILTDLDAAHLVAEHRRIGADATVHLTPVSDPSAFGVVELDETGIVRRFVEKPAPGETDSNLVNAGTYVMETSVLDLVPEGERVSVERVVFPSLVADRRLAGVATDDYWLDSGVPEAYLRANLDLIRGVRGEAPNAVAADARIDAGSAIADTVVESGVVVESGATVAASHLLPGAWVEHGATVVDSIVAGRVGAGATLHGCVVGAAHAVAAGASHRGERLPRPE